MRSQTAKNAIKRVKAELTRCFPSVSISSKYQATNSPSKIEGAGGSMMILSSFPSSLAVSLVFILPLPPSILEGELTSET